MPFVAPLDAPRLFVWNPIDAIIASAAASSCEMKSTGSPASVNTDANGRAAAAIPVAAW